MTKLERIKKALEVGHLDEKELRGANFYRDILDKVEDIIYEPEEPEESCKGGNHSFPPELLKGRCYCGKKPFYREDIDPFMGGSLSSPAKIDKHDLAFCLWNRYADNNADRSAGAIIDYLNREKKDQPTPPVKDSPVCTCHFHKGEVCEICPLHGELHPNTMCEGKRMEPCCEKHKKDPTPSKECHCKVKFYKEGNVLYPDSNCPNHGYKVGLDFARKEDPSLLPGEPKKLPSHEISALAAGQSLDDSMEMGWIHAILDYLDSQEKHD